MARPFVTVCRQDDRYPVNLTVCCSSGNASASHYATNLSRGGLFIASGTPLPVDSLTELTLTFPGPLGPVRALARVVWATPARAGWQSATPGMGLRFLSLSSDHWGRLLAFLASLPPPTDAGLDLRALRSGAPRAAHADLGELP